MSTPRPTEPVLPVRTITTVRGLLSCYLEMPPGKVASIAGLGRPAVYAWRHGKLPNDVTLLRLSARINLSPSEVGAVLLDRASQVLRRQNIPNPYEGVSSD